MAKFKPKLVIASTGIRPEHCSFEAAAAMMQAEKLYHWSVNAWVAALNPNSYNIEVVVGRRNAESRSHAYEDMAEVLLCELRSGRNVTYAQYGNAAIANTRATQIWLGIPASRAI